MKHFLKTLVIALPIWALIMGLMYYGVFILDSKPKTGPVNIQYFKQGDTLLPDMICSDTLIVMDASGLNKDMALIEQGIIESTDSQIDSVIHLHSIDINK